MAWCRALRPAQPSQLCCPGHWGQTVEGERGVALRPNRPGKQAGPAGQQQPPPSPSTCGSHEGGFLSTSSSAHPAELLSSSKLLGSLAHCSEGTATVVIGVNRGVHAGALGSQLKCRLHVPYMENHALLRELCPVLLSQKHPTHLSNRSEINTRAHGVRKECWLRGNCFNDSHWL